MRSDRVYEVIDGQNDFSGGMVLAGEPAPNQYRYSENIIIRHGTPETRPGIGRFFRKSASGLVAGFYFNQDNATYSDLGHTGFWFSFQFVGSAWGTVQGCDFFKFKDDTSHRLIFVSDGYVRIQNGGFVTTVPTEESIATSETIEFVQANEWLIMFRSGDKNAMRWDGSANGFELFTLEQEKTTNVIPTGNMGAYQGGRLWVRKDDDLYASDIFDFDNYDYVYQLFGINPGDGNTIKAIIPWHDDNLIIAKDRAIYGLSGINSASVDVAQGTVKLSDNVRIEQLLSNSGIVGRYAYAVHGEILSFISYDGIRQLQRTQQGNIVGVDVTLSAPIQPLIDRINPNYIHNSCAVAFQNYLLFAVPMDNATVNNAILVFDLTLNTWVSVWKSDIINPVRFFAEKEKLYSLGSDNILREMFRDDPVDSQDAVDDTRIWLASEEYSVGDIRRATNEDSVLYICIKENIGQALTDTNYWSVVSDTTSLYRITSLLKSRFYKHDDETSPKKYGRCEVAVRHQNPSVTVETEDREYGTKDTVVSSKTYSQILYEVNNQADWDDTNIDDDFDSPGREDYTVLFDEDDGIYMDADEGIDIGTWTTHGLKFIPRVMHNREFSVIVTNTQGKINIKSIVCKGQQGQFAKYGR